MSEIDCKCPLQNQISTNGLTFLIDQITERNFTLNSYPFDINSDENENALCDTDDRSASLPQLPHLQISSTDLMSSGPEDSDAKENEDPDYVPKKFSTVPHKILLPGSLTELNLESVFAGRFDLILAIEKLHQSTIEILRL
jgi:hypothetical protein